MTMIDAIDDYMNESRWGARQMIKALEVLDDARIEENDVKIDKAKSAVKMASSYLYVIKQLLDERLDIK